MEVSPYEALCIKQDAKEDVETYWSRLQAAAAQFDNTAEAWPDFLLRDVFVRNLRSARCRQALRCRELSTSAEAVKFAVDWEQCDRICFPSVQDMLSANEHGDDSPPNARVALIKELEDSSVPRDLAHEIADLVEEAQYCMFLTQDPNEALLQTKAQELERLLVDNPLLKENHEYMKLNLEWCRFRIGPLQMRTAGGLFSIPLKAPWWMRQLNKTLPNNIVLPASM